MEQKQKTKFTRSITFKGLMIALMTLVMLIPGCMIRELIRERESTRNEAVRTIDAKWSYAQTIGGPILVIPYTQTAMNSDMKPVTIENAFNVTPERLDIKATLLPEERHYGIYKTILYKSTIVISGNFASVPPDELPAGDIHWESACLKFGVSDLRGISDNITFDVNGSRIQARAAGESDRMINEILKVPLSDITPGMAFAFSGELNLKGSGSINFIPVGQTTTVTVSGAWADPGFIGNYTPEYSLGGGEFTAGWKILSFNRSIPQTWSGNTPRQDAADMSFGVSLVDTVDIYQQNMRSVKYALMFIALTFVTFFFVEVINRKRIHPIQYILVGIALTLFYSLLLSISEPLGFGRAYLISGAATIALITGYTSTIFRNRRQTTALGLILSGLYLFLYVILQLEEMALLAGSVGLFVILGVIMYLSRRINWYNEEA